MRFPNAGRSVRYRVEHELALGLTDTHTRIIDLLGDETRKVYPRGATERVEPGATLWNIFASLVTQKTVRLQREGLR